MTMTTTIRAEHVGSLLRPQQLLSAQERYEAGTASEKDLRAAEDAAALEVLALQRESGIGVLTDGEVRRESFMASVVETVGGLVPIDAASSSRPRWFTDDGGEVEGEITPMAIGAELFRKTPQALTEAAFLVEHTAEPFKITMASPTMLAPLWRPGISETAYPRCEDAVAALSEIYCRDIVDLIDAGVRWLQLDSLAYWPVIDPNAASMRGVTDVDALMTRTIATDNRLIRAARAHRDDVTVGMHFCRGNMQSAWAVTGGYEPLAERLFSEVEVDRFLLEFDTERSGGFEPLRFVPEGKVVVLGLVSTKTPQLESSEDLLRRIEEAAQYLPLEQLALSPQCGFASTKSGNLLSVDDERRKLDLVAQTAGKVWG